jgi:LysM repeat protein
MPPTPPPRNLPTSPAVLDITPAPTLDIDATATMLAGELRPTATPAGLYVVQPGDTLGVLAEEFGTSIDEILVANGLTDPNDIQEGQELIIPSLLATPLGETPQPAEATTTPEDAEDATPPEPTTASEEEDATLPAEAEEVTPTVDSSDSTISVTQTP